MVLSKILRSDKLWLLVTIGAGLYWLLIRRKLRKSKENAIMQKQSKMDETAKQSKLPLKNKKHVLDAADDTSNSEEEDEPNVSSACSVSYELHRLLVEGVLLPIVQRHCDSNSVLGFTCEWNIQLNEPSTAQIEICTHAEFSAWFEICCVNHIPKGLSNLLKDIRIIKVGINITEDAITLAQRFNINLRGTLDLRYLVELACTKNGKWIHEQPKEILFTELKSMKDDSREAMRTYTEYASKIDSNMSLPLLIEPYLDKRYIMSKAIQ